MQNSKQLSLIESVARICGSEPETAPIPQERAAMVTDIETTFQNMISHVQAVRSDLTRVFAENSVLSENITPLTSKRMESVVNGLLADLHDLSTRHKTSIF